MLDKSHILRNMKFFFFVSMITAIWGDMIEHVL